MPAAPLFFVPEADAEQAERIWTATRLFLKTQGFETTARRLFAVHYVHHREPRYDEVGKPSQMNGETVLVILEGETLYLSCTENRGVFRGDPLLIGKRPDTTAIQFALPHGA